MTPHWSNGPGHTRQPQSTDPGDQLRWKVPTMIRADRHLGAVWAITAAGRFWHSWMAGGYPGSGLPMASAVIVTGTG
jgi:hypothetical protein